MSAMRARWIAACLCVTLIEPAAGAQARRREQPEEARLYHPVSIVDLHRSSWTHVEVDGRVSLVRSEPDGDMHFRLADREGRWIVCEIIPLIPLDRPARGMRVRVRGIRRWDGRHRWAEVHPVEAWELIGPRAVPRPERP
jgi:hypothetical protein